MNSSKKIFLSLALLSVAILSKAQAFSATYGYDENGNRTSASVIFLSTSVKSATQNLNQVIKPDSLQGIDTSSLPQQGWQPGIDESINNMKIKLYPNPTHGIIIIEISGAHGKQLASNGNAIKICDLQGRETLTINPLDRFNTIDLSGKPNQTYLLRVIISGQFREFKVIKE